MSLPTVTDTDCSPAIEQLRAAIAKGTMDVVDPRYQLAVIQYLIKKASDMAALTDSGTPGTITHDLDVQFTILNAFTGMDTAADIVAAIATAWGVLGPEGDVIHVLPTVPTYVDSSVADG